MLKGIVISPHPPIIIPEVGKGEEKKAEKTIEGMLKISEIVNEMKPEIIIYITPHGNVFQDGICIIDKDKISGDLSSFNAKYINKEKSVDKIFLEALREKLGMNDVSYVFLNDQNSNQYQCEISIDHGCIVPMYFIDKRYPKYKIIHITIGLLPLIELYEVGVLINEVINQVGLETLIVASGDLSHCLKDLGPYEYNEMGAVFDKEVVKSIKDNDFFRLLSMDSDIFNAAGQCGLRPIIMALGAMDNNKTESQIFSYEGPFGVGYMTAFIKELEGKKESLIKKYKNYINNKYKETISKEDEYITLARETINYWAVERKKLSWTEYKNRKLSQKFIKRVENERSGVFVSIYRDGILRGCIGTVSPTTPNISREIIRNSVEAAEYDSRFMPIQEEELPYLDIKVDILRPKEKITSLHELDVKKYGVIVKSGLRKGVLLPNLEGIDTVEEQIKIAKKKAGIHDWEEITMYRFKVERHEI